MDFHKVNVLLLPALKKKYITPLDDELLYSRDNHVFLFLFCILYTMLGQRVSSIKFVE